MDVVLMRNSGFDLCWVFNLFSLHMSVVTVY